MAMPKGLARYWASHRRSKSKSGGKRRMSRKSTYHRSHRMTFPLAVIAGFGPTIFDGIRGAQSGGISGAVSNITYDLTGYDTNSKSWSWQGLVKGWTPIILGVMVHKAAGMIGINRMLATNRVPLIRV